MTLNCFNKMQTIALDSANHDQVSSPRSLDVILGTPPARMVVLTGIAIPSWDSGGNMDGAEVVVDLRTPATQLLEWTATIGLASIVNEDTEFTFGTDQVEVELRNGNLELHACIVVLGGKSYLNRFSYEVTAVIRIDEALIAGTIEWDDGVMAGGPPGGPPWFGLHATTHVDVPGTPWGRDDPVTTADTGLAGPTRAGGANRMPYALRGVPFGTPVTVAVAANGMVDTAGRPLVIEQSSGPPQPITLTGQRPQVLDLDFRVTAPPHLA